MIQSLTCEWLNRLKRRFPELELFKPASPEVIAEAQEIVGSLPPELAALLACSNGLTVGSFRVYSAFDKENVKKTWESLQRANNGTQPNALITDRNFLGRFLVFADIGNGIALIDRDDRTIWYLESQDAEIFRTDFTLAGFIETMVENAE